MWIQTYLTGLPIQFIYARHTVGLSLIVSTQRKKVHFLLRMTHYYRLTPSFSKKRGEVSLSTGRGADTIKTEHDAAAPPRSCTFFKSCQELLFWEYAVIAGNHRTHLPYNFFFALVALTIFGPVKLWTFLDDSQRVPPPKSYVYVQHDVRACGCLCMPTQPWRAVHAPGQAKLNKYSCLYMSTRQLHCVVI